MSQKFIKLLDSRLQLSAIKKYIAAGNNSITIYYTHSRDIIDNEVFVFPDSESRDFKMDELHNNLFEKGFVDIQGLNIKLSMIKKYKIFSGRLYIYYKASRLNTKFEVFKFDKPEDLKDKLIELDAYFGII